MTTEPLDPQPEITTGVRALGVRAATFAVQSARDYDLADDILADIKRRIKGLTAERMAQTRPLDESKARIVDFFRPHLATLEQAEAALKRSMLGWAKEEADRENAARREAEATAEKERIAAERKADRLEAKGKVEQAADLRYEARIAPVLVPLREKPAAAHSSTSTLWSAVVTDKLALVRAVAAGEAGLDLLDVNMVLLNKRAQALRHEMHVPGVKAQSREVMASRAAR